MEILVEWSGIVAFKGSGGAQRALETWDRNTKRTKQTSVVPELATSC